LSHELDFKIITFLAKYTRAKWLVEKEDGIKTEPRVDVLV